MIIHSVHNIRVYLSFLYFSTVKIVNGRHPYGTLVRKNEFLRKLLDIKGLENTIKRLDFFMNWLLKLDKSFAKCSSITDAISAILAH